MTIALWAMVPSFSEHKFGPYYVFLKFAILYQNKNIFPPLYSKILILDDIILTHMLMFISTCLLWKFHSEFKIKIPTSKLRKPNTAQTSTCVQNNRGWWNIKEGRSRKHVLVLRQVMVQTLWGQTTKESNLPGKTF